MKIQGAEGQLPATNTPVIMTEQGTGSDVVQGNIDNNGFVRLQPYIGNEYEIKIEYSTRYEMAKMVVDPTVDEQNFNFYLLQRQIELESERCKTKESMLNLFERMQRFPFFYNLFECFFKNI